MLHTVSEVAQVWPATFGAISRPRSRAIGTEVRVELANPKDRRVRKIHGLIRSCPLVRDFRNARPVCICQAVGIVPKPSIRSGRLASFLLR